MFRRRDPWFWILIGTGVVSLIGICVFGGLAVWLGLGYVDTIAAGQEIGDPPPIVIPTLANQTPIASDENPDLGPVATVTLPVLLPEGNEAEAIDVVRTTEPIIIDGEISEWGAIETVRGSYRVYSADTWDGTDDLVPIWRIAWDNDALYVAVEVIDDTHVQLARGGETFLGDSLDLQLDMERAADLAAAVSPDDYQIQLSPGNFVNIPPDAYRYQGTADGQLRPSEGFDIQVAAIKTQFGYHLEARIPWDNLGTSPFTGLEIGANLNATDNDSEGQLAQEVMMSTNPNRTYSDPTTWGILVLR